MKFLNLNLISPPGTLRNDVRALLPDGCVYADSYGLTELCCVIYQRYNDDTGYTIFGGKHLIKDMNSDAVLPPTEKGELLINSRYIMDGYYNDKEITRNCYKAINGEKYLLTGDIGYLDEMDRFYYVDRLKRMDKIGGYSVFPAEIEAVIKTVPNIVNCVVARKTDANGKHYLTAYLQVSDKTKFDETAAETKNTISMKLNKFHVPLKFLVMDGIRRTPMGKNDYRYYEGLGD